MKFRFCGELECPDYILSEIATLSKITSVKMKMLCDQLLNDILGMKSIDFDKINKLSMDAKYEKSDVKATIAALCFIFMSSAKNSVDDNLLRSELQQLGLPKESTNAVCKCFSEKCSLLREKLEKDSLKLLTLEHIHWDVNYIMSSSLMLNMNDVSITITLKINKNSHPEGERKHSEVVFSMSIRKYLHFLKSLKEAYAIMEEMSS